MSDASKEEARPRLKDILAGDDWKTATAGLSEGDIAKVLGPIAGLSGGLFHVTMKAGEAIGQGLGLKSTKQEERSFSYPYPLLVRSLILALANQRQEVRTMLDTPRGAFVEADLPKDFFSLGGTLQFDIIEESPLLCRVIAATEIKGQMFDWGKGKRVMNAVLSKTEQLASRLADRPSSPPPLPNT